MTLDIGRVIADRYEITEKIGQGGMSIVYKAMDKKLNRAVSLKVLREEYSVDEDFRKRFIREARSVASLNHQNIVNVYDVAHEEEINYIIMEYIAGVTLKELIVKRAPFSNQEALGVAIQMAAALIHAHGSKIIHRDIKPQNVMVTGKGVIKVADFGIARRADSNSVTVGGSTTLGSVHYFSPEQAKGIKTDPRSDLYSLGIVLFEMFAGELPYDADTAVSVALMQINDPLPDIRRINPDVSPKVKLIIERLTEKNPDNRYQNAETLLKDLRAVIADPNAALSFDGEPRLRIPEIKDYDSHLDVSLDSVYEAEEPAHTRRSGYDRRDERFHADDEDDYDDGYIRGSDEDEDVYYDTAPSKRRRGGDERPLRPEGRKKGGSVEKHERVVRNSAIVTALIVVLAAGIFLLPKLFEYIRDYFGDNTKIVYLPKMESVDYERLSAQLAEMGVEIEILNEVHHNTVPQGAVINATYEEGAAVTEGTVVEVNVSLGKQMIDLPDFIGMQYKDAAAKHQQDKIPVRIIEKYEYNDAPPSEVFDQEPRAGLVEPLTEVTLFISQGKEIESFALPNFRGMSEAQAKEEMARLGLSLGVTSQRHSADVAEGQVMNQTPESGRQVITGSTVNLVVSLGPEPSPDPADLTQAGEPGASADPGAQGGEIRPLEYGTPQPQITVTPSELTQTPMPTPYVAETPPQNIFPSSIPATPEPTMAPYVPPQTTHALPTPAAPYNQLTVQEDDTPIIPAQVGNSTYIFTITPEMFEGKREAMVKVSSHTNYIPSEVLPDTLFQISQLPYEIAITCPESTMIQYYIDSQLKERISVTTLPQR